VSGLAANQAQIDLISQNVANANSVGYIKRQVTTTSSYSGSVQTGAVTRAYDQLVQRQLRTENAGGAYSSIMSQYAQQLNGVFGQTDANVSLDGAFNSFTSALQALSSDPSSSTARAGVLQSAQAMADRLNTLSASVQELRTNAEQQIASDVTVANNALKGLEDIARQLGTTVGAPDVSLLDQRDSYIDQLSKLGDIKVNEQPNGQVTIYTNSGVTLFDGSKGVRFQFDQRTSVGPNALYNADPSKSGVGQLLIVTPSGASIDAGQQNVFRSGEFKGLLDLRDQVLPEAQTQLDELAAGLSRALSDASPAATPVSAGAQNGFAIDLSGIQPGNTTRITFQQGGVTKTISLVAVDNPSVLPLPVGATGNPNDIVIGVSFAGGTAGALADIQSALTAAGTNLTVTNPSGNVLQVLDDGTGASTVAGVSANITSNLLSGGGAELPLFVDSATGEPYTGSFDAGSQRTGFASRITINPAVLADTGVLVNYTGATDAGDATRPNLLLDRLTGATQQFSYEAGLTGTNQPYSGTIGGFLTGIIASQGANAVQAQNLDAGQQVVVNSLQAKVASTSGVSIDEELSNLIKMQNAYSANARIISVVQDLFDVLDRI